MKITIALLLAIVLFVNVQSRKHIKETLSKKNVVTKVQQPSRLKKVVKNRLKKKDFCSDMTALETKLTNLEEKVIELPILKSKITSVETKNDALEMQVKDIPMLQSKVTSVEIKNDAMKLQLEQLTTQMTALQGTVGQNSNQLTDVNTNLQGVAAQNIMMTSEFKGMYDINKSKISSNDFTPIGALVPTGNVNDPLNYQQTDQKGGWNCMGAKQSDGQAYFIVDLKTSQPIKKMAFFSYKTYMKNMEVFSYSGSETTVPIGGQSGWVSQGKIQDKTFDNYKENYNQVATLENLNFTTRFLQFSVTADDWQIICGVKAFSI